MFHNLYRLFKIGHGLTSWVVQPLFWAVAIALAVFKLIEILPVLRKIFGQIISRKRNLAGRYGEGSWAVITGSSSGIGKEFALELASHKFNIVLIARNQEKLQAVEKEIKSKYPSTQVKIVLEDFENATKDGFAERIHNQVKDLDISILINNAGGWKTVPMIEQSTKDVQEIISVNALAPALLTRVFLPQLAARRKSAVISVSSAAQDQPLTNIQVYAATKVFLDHLTRGLIDENKNVDFLSLRPFFVATKFTGEKSGGDVVKPEQTVKAALRSLGYVDYTYGHWKHSIFGHMARYMPNWFRRNSGKQRVKKE